MQVKKSIKTRLLKTPALQQLAKSIASENGEVVVSPQEIEKARKEERTKMELERLEKTSNMQELVKQEIIKRDAISKREATQFRYPNQVNANTNPDRKIGSDVPFSYLRRMSVVYPIARACINRRISQITQLAWDVVPVSDKDDADSYRAQIDEIKTLFKNPMGARTRMRELLTMAVDDLLTVDAVCFEVQKTRGGGLYRLIPVDPTTILLKVTEQGGTPEPPEDAYVQMIKGQQTAAFTIDEMIYECMGNRTSTPYGLAPLESLIMQVESAIRGAQYNLNYLRENNIPEGFITLPEDVATTKELVEQWQMWFDAMVAGDPRFTHRLKILPGGSEYVAAKKPEDMQFERFELWLMQQTCMMFGVPPQEIGITYQVNKSTGQKQDESGNERGLIPTANFFKEFFDDLIQYFMGQDKLQFKWVDINPVDRKEEAEIAEREINMGAISVDEYRQSTGREPIGLGHYIKAGSGPIKVEDFISGKYEDDKNKAAEAKTKQNEVNAGAAKDQKKKDAPKKSEIEDLELLKLKDIKVWRECIYKDIKDDKPLRMEFRSDHIDPETYSFIKSGLQHVHSRFQAKIFFDQFLDPDIRSAMKLLNYADDLRKGENESPDSN